MIEAIFICTIFGVFIIFSFLKGIQIGIKLKSDEPIEMKSPVQIVKEFKEAKIYEKKQKEIDHENEINLFNIDVYDGSDIGQKDF